MICCLARGVVLDQVLKAFLALSTAASISSRVEWGTLVTTWRKLNLRNKKHISIKFSNLIGGWVVDINPPVCAALNPLAIDDILCCLRDFTPRIAQTSPENLVKINLVSKSDKPTLTQHLNWDYQRVASLSWASCECLWNPLKANYHWDKIMHNHLLNCHN